MQYNITDLLATAFDIKVPIRLPDPVSMAKVEVGQKYIIQDAKSENNTAIYSSLQMKNEEFISNSKSWMGTPILFPFTFLNEGLDKPYKVFKPNGELEDVLMEKFVLPAATMLDFSRAKNIIKTEVLGGEGTVKELFGFDDWKFRIRGICLTDNSRTKFKTATEQKLQLLAWEKIAGSVKVQGVLFSELNVSEIVIESINIKTIEGRPDYIPFEIQAVSNSPISLIA